jgi:YesN/AraC family two-component response regulator
MVKAVILVIDDDPKVKESLELAFPQYQFFAATSGEAGLEILKKPNDIDLVILDFKMKGMNGVEVLTKAKQVSPHTGIIMMTGFGSREVVIDALSGHADDFLDKPFDLNQIEKKLDKFFESRHQKSKDTGSQKSAVQRILRLLEINTDKSLTLKDAAEAVSLSPKYVSRLFKEETSSNFSRLKIKLKIERAKKLLSESSLDIGEIADRLGYQNSPSFMKIFKKITGYTPTEYREKKSV